MDKITATKNPADLHDVLGHVEKVFLNLKTNQLPSALTNTFDYKLPVLDEAVVLKMGDADVTRVRLIDQTNWTSYAKKGDPDVSLQIPSFSRDIANLLGNKIGTESANATVGAKFQGYSSSPKKLAGSLLYVSDDNLTCVYLPNVEIISTPVLGENNNPAYFNAIITPLPDSAGADYYIGIKTIITE